MKGAVIMKKLFLATAVVFALACTAVSAYSDVPQGHWAEEYIKSASEKGVMNGMGQDLFGLGQNVKRSEFAAMMCRLMGWDLNGGEGEVWYAPYVQSLKEHNAADPGDFRPDDYITRSEMAEMLVRGLGFSGIETGQTPFLDADSPYVTAAYDFGIINGKEAGIFAPGEYASREEGAAMMCRLYDRYYHKLDMVHGFYAISSWGQRDMAKDMDAVSFGWSRLEYNGGPVLNTSAENGNDWRIPDGYEDAVDFFAQNEVKTNLAVLMNTSLPGENGENACQTILESDENRKKAAALIAEASKDYAGVTIDFEGLKGIDLKNSFVEFLRQLRYSLPEGKLLYTAVHPVMSGEYFDGYDYESIGNLSDMVILMAHDYGAVSMNEDMRNVGFTITPVTPFNEVYTALKAISTQIENKDKIALGLSVASTAGWRLDSEGRVTNEIPIHPSPETVSKRLRQPDTVIDYSEKYRNPRAVYNDDEGNEIVLWYENARSITDKIELARMFGINKASVWRIGQLQNDASIGMDMWDKINLMR